MAFWSLNSEPIDIYDKTQRKTQEERIKMQRKESAEDEQK